MKKWKEAGNSAVGSLQIKNLEAAMIRRFRVCGIRMAYVLWVGHWAFQLQLCTVHNLCEGEAYQQVVVFLTPNRVPSGNLT